MTDSKEEKMAVKWVITILILSGTSKIYTLNRDNTKRMIKKFA